MPTGSKALQSAQISDKKERGKSLTIVVLALILLLILVMFSLRIRVITNELMPNKEVIYNLKLWSKVIISKLFKTPFQYEAKDLIRESFYYHEVVSRLKITFMTMIAGAVLSVSGAVFQGVFKNPMAAPTMLGVTNGVSLGLIFLVVQYSTNAVIMVKEKYLYCYGFSLLLLIIVILAGRFVGKNRTSVTDMFFVGAIISQIASAVTTFYRYTLQDDDLLALQQMQMGTQLNVDDISILILTVVTFLALIPIFMTRFSFNAISFDEDDAHSLGINVYIMRLILLVAGTALVTASMIHLGSIGMISLVVPHMVRYVFGCNFKKVFWGSMISGAILMLICRAVSSMTTLGVIGALPMSTIVSIITTPIFIIILTKQKRGWE